MCYRILKSLRATKGNEWTVWFLFERHDGANDWGCLHYHRIWLIMMGQSTNCINIMRRPVGVLYYACIHYTCPTKTTCSWLDCYQRGAYASLMIWSKCIKFLYPRNSQIWETRNSHFWTRKLELATRKFQLATRKINSLATTRRLANINSQLAKSTRKIQLACSQLSTRNSQIIQTLILCRTEYKILTLKELGFLDPSHSRGGGGGGADSAPPPKISETDWRNIKCVVLVDSYDPPESIGTKKSTNMPCMTPQWRHKWRHVKNTKITKNRQNHGFSLFFQAKVPFFGNDVCQSMLTHVLTPNKPNK